MSDRFGPAALSGKTIDGAYNKFARIPTTALVGAIPVSSDIINVDPIVRVAGGTDKGAWLYDSALDKFVFVPAGVRGSRFGRGPISGKAGAFRTELWTAADYGLLAMAFDPWFASIISPVFGQGSVITETFWLPEDTQITNIHHIVGVPINGPIAGQNFVALHQGNTLLGVSNDQSTAWGSSGFKTAALAGGPAFALEGPIQVSFWSNATVSVVRFYGPGGPGAYANLGLSGSSARLCINISAATTTPPSPLNLGPTTGAPIWCGVS